MYSVEKKTATFSPKVQTIFVPFSLTHLSSRLCLVLFLLCNVLKRTHRQCRKKNWTQPSGDLGESKGDKKSFAVLAGRICRFFSTVYARLYYIVLQLSSLSFRFNLNKSVISLEQSNVTNKIINRRSQVRTFLPCIWDEI